MHQKIGKYHVIRAAGSGGFGAVYEGYDVELDRNVAIKICTGGENQVERFRREARIVSQLKHRNVALVFDFGYDDVAGVHFLVEEFLSGVDLDKKIEERDRLPPALRLRYLMGIAQGLEFVHERGLIHRDLSPRNIRVLHDHTIKIMDFGLAKDLTDSTLTLIGDNFGTVGYTAPEQITGMRTVDHRTDIFSFGVIAYELLTLSNPFMTANMGTFIHKIHHHEPTPLSELWPDCPPDLAAAVHRCILKNPDERFSSCAEILKILKKVLRFLRRNEVPIPFAPPGATEDSFGELLDSAHGAADIRSVVDGTADKIGSQAAPPGHVDSAKLTSHLPGPSGDSTHLLLDAPKFDTPMPLAPVTERVAPEILEPSDSPTPRAGFSLKMAGGLVALALTVAALVALVLSAPWSNTGAQPVTEHIPPVTDSPPPVVSPSYTFELSSRFIGTANLPSIQLLATVPPNLEGWTHCYILRTPQWSYGPKIRLDDCSGQVFRHVDKVDIHLGESYTYQVILANEAGNSLVESSSTLFARESSS